MGESRLSSLALMHIKYDMLVDLDEIVNLFQDLHPRKMQLSSLLYKKSFSELVSKWPQSILGTWHYM